MNDCTGVYKITNTVSKEVYIGESKHCFIRKQQH